MTLRPRPTKAPTPLSHYRVTVRLREELKDLKEELQEMRSFLLSRYRSQFREYETKSRTDGPTEEE